MWTSADPLTRQSAGRMVEHKKEPPHYWDNVTADTKIKGVCVWKYCSTISEGSKYV